MKSKIFIRTIVTIVLIIMGVSLAIMIRVALIDIFMFDPASADFNDAFSRNDLKAMDKAIRKEKTIVCFEKNLWWPFTRNDQCK